MLFASPRKTYQISIRASVFGIAHRNSMVGVPGIEPGTSSLSGTRSNQLSYTPKKTARAISFGGGNRVRTGGPELAKLVLYQLSYAPSC